MQNLSDILLLFWPPDDLIWSRDCNPRIQRGVAILTKKKFQKYFACFYQMWYRYNKTIIASTSDQEIIKAGPWDLRTKSSLNPGRQTCESRQNFTDLMGCRYVSSSMPQSWIIRGHKQVKHRQQRELTSENERETATKSQKKRTCKACKTTVIHCYICNANFWRSCRRRRCGYLSSLLCRVAFLSARSSGFRITCKTSRFLLPSKIALQSQVLRVFSFFVPCLTQCLPLCSNHRRDNRKAVNGFFNHAKLWKTGSLLFYQNYNDLTSLFWFPSPIYLFLENANCL